MAEKEPIKGYQEREKREEYAYKFYLNRGYSPQHSAAIVGNLISESNLNTTVLGKADTKGSRGVAQWHSGRLDNLKGKYGTEWTNFDNQLDFVDWELKNTHKKVGDNFKKTQGLWDVSRVFTNDYERPKVKFDGDEKRQTNVADVYRKYGKQQLTEEDKKLFSQNVIKYKKPLINNQAETNTTPLTNFDISIDKSNFVSVPELKKEEEIPSKKEEKSESLEKLKEDSFLKDYKSLYAQQEQQQQEQPINPIQSTNLEDIYNQVSNFVDTPYAQKGGEIVKDNNGYWNPDNWGKTVEISSGKITMEGVNQPLIGYSPETGERKLMLPGNNYNFKGAKRVIESPLKQNEIDFLNSLK